MCHENVAFLVNCPTTSTLTVAALTISVVLTVSYNEEGVTESESDDSEAQESGDRSDRD
jgi:hypothetical protein